MLKQQREEMKAALRLGRRMRAAYADLDLKVAEYLKRPDAHRPTCKGVGFGCNGCCYQLLIATLPEAVLIAETMVRDPNFERRPVFRRLVEQARIFESGAPITKRSWFDRREPCPFLEAGACSIYEVRPSACRYHYVVSEPANCEPGAVDSRTSRIDFGQAFSYALSEAVKVSRQANVPLLILPLPVAVHAATQLLAEGRPAFSKRFPGDGSAGFVWRVEADE